MTSDFWPIDLINHSGLSVISITLSSQAIYHFMEAQWAYLLRNTVEYTHSLHSIEQSWTRNFTNLMQWDFTIFCALIKSITWRMLLLQVAFIQKVLIKLSFPQTDKPHYFPEFEFCNCEILKGSNHVI